MSDQWALRLIFLSALLQLLSFAFVQRDQKPQRFTRTGHALRAVALVAAVVAGFILFT